MRLPSVLAMVLAASMLQGCITTMKVSSVKADASAKGFRYFLPKPYLLVTPKADGSVAVEKVFLPDPENEYAIDTAAYAASYKLSVQLDDHGLLKKIIWNTGSAESTKAALETVANLSKARIDVESARAKAEAEKAGKAAEKREKLEAEVHGAELELATAEAELQVLESKGGSADKILAARIAVEKALRKLQAAKDALARFEANAIDGGAGMNDPTARAADPCRRDPWPLRAWGPVLIEVVDKPDRVELRAVNTQEYLPTSKRLTAEAGEGKDVVPAVRVEGSGILYPAKKLTTIVVKSDTPIKKLEADAVDVLTIDGKAADKGLIQLNLSMCNEVLVELLAKAPAGKYELTFPIVVLENGRATPKPVTVGFVVAKP